MNPHGVIPGSFLALAVVWQASTAFAQAAAAKPAAQSAPAPRPAKAAAAADPFEQDEPAVKPAARPTPPPPKAAPAPAAIPTQEPPSKELAAFMKPLEGSWKCETKFEASAIGGGQPRSAKTEVTIRKEPGGYSWHGEFRLAKTPTTAATSGVFQIGYSPSTKQATFLSYDSVGTAMMGAGTLAGDSVTFVEEGFLKGIKVRVRETLARRGPRKLYHKVEIEQGNGFQTMAEDLCSK